MKADKEFGKKMIANQKRKKLTKVEKDIAELVKSSVITRLHTCYDCKNQRREFEMVNGAYCGTKKCSKGMFESCTFCFKEKYDICKPKRVKRCDHLNANVNPMLRCIKPFGHSGKHESVIKW